MRKNIRLVQKEFVNQTHRLKLQFSKTKKQTKKTTTKKQHVFDACLHYEEI
jgi:hypothetical protein